MARHKPLNERRKRADEKRHRVQLWCSLIW